MGARLGIYWEKAELLYEKYIKRNESPFEINIASRERGGLQALLDVREGENKGRNEDVLFEIFEKCIGTVKTFAINSLYRLEAMGLYDDEEMGGGLGGAPEREMVRAQSPEVE